MNKLCHHEVCSQLAGGEKGGGGGGGGVKEVVTRPVVIHVDQKTPVSTSKRTPSRNYKKADLDSFKQFAEEECTGQLSEENINQNAIRFNDAILRAAKKSIPWGRRRNSRLHS